MLNEVYLLQESWVPQPSPCCAAASVAGAYNSLWRLGREADDACGSPPVHFRPPLYARLALHCTRFGTLHPVTFPGTVREVADILAENKQLAQARQQRRIDPGLFESLSVLRRVEKGGTG